MFRDQAFANINPPDWKYKKSKPAKYLTNEDYNNFVQNIVAQATDGIGEFASGVDPARLQAVVDAKATQVVSMRDYGLSGIAEDKADFASILFQPQFYASVVDIRKPLIRKKFIFLLARLYRDNPSLVKYFAATSSRPADRSILVNPKSTNNSFLIRP